MNYEYIRSKGALILEEIIHVANNPNKPQIVGAKAGTEQISDNSQVLKFKLWQLYSLGAIAATPQDKLLKHYTEEYALLCDKCKASFLDGDAGCKEEFERFVLCRMMFQAGGNK